MKRLVILLPLLALLAACDTEEQSLDCTQESDDLCLQDACQACVDACGADCEVMDIYPMEYSCPGGDIWDVYDVCPDWGGDSGL